MNAPVKFRLPLTPMFGRLATVGQFLAIPLTSTTLLNSITGVVYAKPNVTANPPTSCKFWTDTPAITPFPTTLNHIYTVARGPTPANAVNSDHSNWPPNTPKTKFDVNLGKLGFNYANRDVVAIAFNLDDNVNSNLVYTYQFEYSGTGNFQPVEAIMEGNSTTSLSWIYEDVQGNFSYCVNANGVGKTVVVVCPMVQSTTFSLINFNLAITAVNPNDPTDAFTTIFDPKIKNDG